MKDFLKEFFFDSYLCTGGFIPVFSLGEEMEIGDFFLISDGQIVRLGSLKGNEDFFDFEFPVIESKPFQVDTAIWQMQNAVKTSFKSPGASFEFKNIFLNEFQQALIIEFEKRGGYFYRCRNPEKRVFENFDQLSDQILQKMVTKEFNFKEIFIVTEVVSNSESAFIAAADDGNITIDFVEEGYFDLHDLVKPEIPFSAHQSKNIGYQRLKCGGNDFIKAVKMDVSIHGQHIVTKHIENHFPENLQKHKSNLIKYGKTNLLQFSNIYPGNAVDYYTFNYMGLEDVNKLFYSC